MYLHSYPVFGQICGWHAVHLPIGGVVGQVDSQHHRQHQDPEETEQQHPGPGHPHPVTPGERAAAVALLQRLVPPTGPGHDSEMQSPCNVDQSALTATCPNRLAVGGRSTQEVEEDAGSELKRSVVLFQHSDPSFTFDSLSCVDPILDATPAAQVFGGMVDFKAALIKLIQETLKCPQKQMKSVYNQLLLVNS